MLGSKSKKESASTGPQVKPAADQGKEYPPEEKRPAKKRRRKRSPKKKTTPPSPQQSHLNWDESSFKVEPEEGKTRFHDLNLPSEIMHALADMDFAYCTPIQGDTLPHTLTGKDAAGRAQTGTGKSAAFLITVLSHMLRTSPPSKRRHGTPRALILAPTRELVLQIEEDAKLLGKYCDLTTVAVLGGTDYQKQQRQLTEQKVDIVVATPGRLLDFKRQKYVQLDKVEILVIDEADRMLDMGFIPDVRQIVFSTPAKEKRQTLLFSATLTPEVTNLSSQWTRDPLIVEIEPEQVVTETVRQDVYLVTRDEKFPLLYNLVTKEDLNRVMIFCNRRDETRFLKEKIQDHGLSCAMLSGEVAQKKRQTTLAKFKNGDIRILVATDVAGRGIHIDGVSHVINYTLPYDPEDYVHRIGRTGRAGASGISVSFADESDSFQIPDIEGFIGEKLHCIHPPEELLESPPPPKKRPKKKPSPHRRPGGNRTRGKGGRPRRPQGKRSSGPAKKKSAPKSQ